MILLPNLIKLWLTVSAVCIIHGFHTYPLPKAQKPVDGIVVFTGAENRIKTGVDLLSNKYGKKLFVSGLYPHNHFENKYPYIIPGFKAKNTKGNVKELNGWIEEYKLKSCLIITNDFHIPRIRMLYSMQETNPDIDMNFLSIKECSYPQAIWYRLIESQKLIRTIGEYILNYLKS